MGYPTIDKFDIKFIERTKQNVTEFDKPNKFTHLINSLVGLVFIPNEFNKKSNRTYKIDFLNKPISELGISPALLYRWRKEYQERGESSFPGNGVRSREGETRRVAELEKRLKEAETERDILKKALGIISTSGR